MGYGVIRVRGKQVELVEMGALHLTKYKDHAVKLKRIFDRCAALIETHAPDHLAVEAPFFGKNVQSMLKLGRAQGVALAAALSRDIPVSEYAPRKVKQAITWIRCCEQRAGGRPWWPARWPSNRPTCPKNSMPAMAWP